MFAEACVRLRLSSSLLTTFLYPLSQKSAQPVEKGLVELDKSGEMEVQ